MERYQWIEREFSFGLSRKMFPFYLERLEGTIARLEAKVKDLSDAVLSYQLEGKWSIKEIIGHLAEVDDIALNRIDEIVYGTTPFSCAAMKNKQDYNAMAIQSLLHQFARVRRKTIERFNNVADDEMSRTSSHPRLKIKMTPVDLAWFSAEHDDHHLVRINEIIALMKRVKVETRIAG